MVRLFLLSFVSCSCLIWAQESQAVLLEVPEEFPGHNISRQITGDVKVPDEFNPQDYQQNKHLGEGACNFNSFLAGIMHTSYGRSKVQALVESQDENFVNFRFYFPSPEIFESYKFLYDICVKECEENLERIDSRIKIASSESDVDMFKQLKKNFDERIEKAKVNWDRLSDLQKTTIKVPKKFVTRSEGGSFPQNNPDWLNLMQQAYMKITKNTFLRKSDAWGGYTTDEKISEEDVFLSVPHCWFSSESNYEWQDCLNLLEAPEHESLEFFPLIDIALKSVNILTSRETGLDIQGTKDVKAKIEGDGIVYEKITYTDVVDFAHGHGLTKSFLMAPNVIQFNNAGHAVALIFSGEGQVYYYDNVVYDSQIDVYGEKGPIYQEAKYFEGKDLEKMSEKDFFTCLFQEIDYRKDQVCRIRGQESYPATTIKFFTKPLLEHQ